ncbi:hypothetical protein [Dongshaea marina]|uniref:hypothetical protein n=1 Tax=Dongshaea marina TaxID=2047966 RepID=UPI000D3E6286|nr:hypothetical protein [Dongshaea marina]
MRTVVLITLLGGVLTMLSACSSAPPDTHEQLGQFTVASSFDIRNLEYDKTDSSSHHVSGKSCYKVDPETLAHVEGPQDNLLQRAMDRAIRNGQNLGIDGDLLVNVRIEKQTRYKESGLIFTSRERFECIVVSGDLVKVKTDHP